MTDGPHTRVEWFTVITKTCPVSTVNFQSGIWEAYFPYRFCVLYSVNCCRCCRACCRPGGQQQASLQLRMYDALQHRDDRRKMQAACRKGKYGRRHGDQLEQVMRAVDHPCLHLPRSHASTALAPPRFKTPPTVAQSKLHTAAWCPARIPRPALRV